VLVAIGFAVVAGGCGGNAADDPVGITSSDEQLIQQSGTWVNSLGLAQTDPGTWRTRLERACSEGVWDREVAMELATQFIEEDVAVSVRAEGLGMPSVEDGARALWTMAVNVCRDAFPVGAVEDGPP
jgi:hypothetical protein